MRTSFVIVLSVLASSAFAADRPNNPVGVHLMIRDARTPENIENHTAWARRVTGPWGYAKIFEYRITPETQGPDAGQVAVIKKCYERELIPVCRVGGIYSGGIWQKPTDTPDGTYGDIAEAFKRVVAGYPLSDQCPLYIEVWNEPNLGVEWSRTTDPAAFAKFYVRTAKAIRSLNNPRIRISPGALSPGGEYESLKFLEACCKAEPEFVKSFDWWATHPYPQGTPPWRNAHDDPKSPRYAAIDLWVHELKVLKENGCDISDLKVIGTETSYRLGHGGDGINPLIDEYRRADYHVRTIRDHWMKYPEVLGMCIWEFSEPHLKATNSTWVHSDSTTDETGWPSMPTLDYEYVAALAKPTTDYACVSGKLLDAHTGGGIPGVTVKLEGSNIQFVTDRFGNYFLSPIPPTQGKTRTARYQSKSHGNGALTFKAKAGENVVIDRKLKVVEPATLRGIVMNSEAGKRLASAEALLEPGGFKVKANSAGVLEFTSIPQGYYDVVVAKEGFIPHKQVNVYLPAGEVTEMTFNLGPGTAVADVDNLLTNTSFEGSDDGASIALGWKGSGASLDREQLYVGNQSQRLTAKKGEPASIILWTAYTSIEEGKRYRLQAWAKTKGVKGDAGKGFKLTGTVVTNPHQTLIELQTKPVTGDTGWQLLTIEFTAPANAGRVSLEMVLDSNEGVAWVDEVAVYELKR